MLTNYYTLLRLCKELKSLTGMKLIECFSQEKDSIVLAFCDGDTIANVFFSAKPNAAALYRDDNFKRARSNSIDLLDELKGNTLQNVELVPDDRIIIFHFVGYKIYFLLFAGASANMILCKDDNRIAYSLNNKNHAEQDIFQYSGSNIKSFGEFLGSENAFKSFAKSDILLGKYYSEEIFASLNISKDSLIADLTQQQKLDLFKKAEQFISSLTAGDKSYILQTNAEPLFSLAKLTCYGEVIAESPTVSQAIKRTRILKIRYKIEHSLRQEILVSLGVEQNRLQKRVADCHKSIESRNRAEMYNQIGGLLLSQSEPKSRPGEFIKIFDYSGEEITVKLDPKLNIIENADKYFQKAKKSNQDAKVKIERLPIYEKRLEEINSLIKQTNESDDLEHLKNISKDITISKIINRRKGQMHSPEEKFKSFDIGDGFILYVGKNAANNDELTMKFAKPNDLWLHARGCSGSHAVLPLRGVDKPPKHILKKAAEITAYYSAAKNAKYVPVCYTLKKYVRKPKGANPGAVVIAREEIIMCEPKLEVN